MGSLDGDGRGWPDGSVDGHSNQADPAEDHPGRQLSLGGK